VDFDLPPGPAPPVSRAANVWFKKTSHARRHQPRDLPQQPEVGDVERLKLLRADAPDSTSSRGRPSWCRPVMAERGQTGPEFVLHKVPALRKTSSPLVQGQFYSIHPSYAPTCVESSCLNPVCIFYCRTSISVRYCHGHIFLFHV